ncbi:abnormal spindle-like microcephaly-associated protein homolog [Toxorhynchites rutilus septentrionalis]|uniref:abnormal spindle-like microcephaly-associated protein homolog n=1 Tax=Toxorhynchites rutilus septentrionalis TaxID=329112 RepID=UPI002479AC94|nr:abnormal spindle-like microcephaly-associated protein homolog [Toxorhynchites rutilus septentrionalis]
MNYLLHRQRTPGAVIPVPDELKELMSEISREVLRAQPPNVIGFIADYLEAKLIRRENQIVANKVVDTVLDISLDIIALLDEIGLTREKAERVVQLIREAFRNHFRVRTSDDSLREVFREEEVLRRLVDECEFTDEEALKTGKIIERAYKTYFLRNVYKDYHGPAVTRDWKDAAKHTLGIYAASGATKEEMERAAVRIQAAYRGYYTRKRQELDQKAVVIQQAYRKHQTKQLVSGVLDDIIEDVVDPKFSGREEVIWIVDMVLDKELCNEPGNKQQMEEAAVKIQSVFRGKQTRKHLREHSYDGDEQRITKISLDSLANPPPSSSSKKDLEKAAILAQSAARGHLTRRQIQKEKAAIQIQSHARGHLTRKKLSKNQTDK